MQAIILAGGLGTRLRSVVSDRPKPMADVCGKPFLEYLLCDLKKAGILHVVFAVGYKGNMIEEYFKDGKDYGLSIQYAYEEELLGTAGAIKNVGKYITDNYFMVMNGDTYYKMDYQELFLQANEKDMLVVLRKITDISRYGKVTLDQDRIIGFSEKTDSKDEGLINGGVYIMNSKLLAEIPDRKCSLENEMIPKWLDDGKYISGKVNDGYFIDIGVPEDYFRFINDVKNSYI